MGSYRYLDDEAIADIAFIAEASTLEELFYQAGMATASLQTDLKQINVTESRALDIIKADNERLLKAFLQEIIYYKDAELLFATDFTLRIGQQDGDLHLQGELRGGYFDPTVHPMHNDLKAITWHNFYVKETEKGWQCYVLIDI